MMIIGFLPQDRLVPDGQARSDICRFECFRRLTARFRTFHAGHILHRRIDIGQRGRAHSEQEKGDSQDDGFRRFAHHLPPGEVFVVVAGASAETSAFQSIISTRILTFRVALPKRNCGPFVTGVWATSPASYRQQRREPVRLACPGRLLPASWDSCSQRKWRESQKRKAPG